MRKQSAFILISLFFVRKIPTELEIQYIYYIDNKKQQ